MTFKQIVEEIRTTAAGGLTLAEVGQLLGTLTRQLVALAETLNSGGATKKSVVMVWLSEAIDALVPAVPLPVWLRPFAPLVRSVAARILLAIADGLVEAAVRAMKGNNT